MRGLTLLLAVLVSTFLLTSCDREEKRRQREAQRAQECLDTFCEGDIEPKRNMATEVALKLNGQWFIGPKEYFSTGMNGAAFYWPGKTAAYAPGDFPPGVKGKDFYDVTIEIFLRSNTIPPEPRGYQLIELAEAKGWIASRTTLRPGLDAITMKHVIGPRGYYIDHVTYYVATQLKGSDGLPPVATCSHAHPNDSGGTGFMWQPGIWAGTRMNQKHCADWPEIFQETIRVLQLLRKA